MKPYYESGGITIYRGDCRDVLPTLDPMDLVLTDPPYGLPGEDVGAALEGLRMITWGCAGVFSDWRNSHLFGALPGKAGELAWEYGWISGGRARAKSGAMPTHNTIHLFGDTTRLHFITGSIIHRQPGFSSPRQCSFAKKTGHPFEKPVPLLKWLLAKMDGDSVLDPFCGSGSSLVAAQSLGRKAVGIEIEEKYCEIAARRLDQEVLDLGLVAFLG